MQGSEGDDAHVPTRTRSILGVEIAEFTAPQAIELVVSRLQERRRTQIAFANSNLLIQLWRTKRQSVINNFLVFNDGLALDLASKILFGSMFPENLNGSDLTGKLLSAMPPKTRVFLFGARPHVTKKAAAEVERQFNVQVCGYVDGYGLSPDATVETINRAKPDVLLVALGNPAQELWIHEHASHIEVDLCIGVGAFFDFLTDEKKRAPELVRMARLEWAHRLWLEPGRLWRRYSIDVALFLSLVLLELSKRRGGRFLPLRKHQNKYI